MELEELVKSKRKEILDVAAKRGAYNVRIFGSVARGESTADSDIDFLVEFEDDRSLMDLSGLWLDLEALLGCKVDVAEPEALHWYIRDRVLAEATAI